MNHIPFIKWVGQLIYPPGTIIYWNNNLNPGTIYGGTWEKIQDKFALAFDPDNTRGWTIGQSNIGSTTYTAASHSHTTSHTHSCTSSTHNHGMDKGSTNVASGSLSLPQGSGSTGTTYTSYSGTLSHNHTWGSATLVLNTEGSASSGDNSPPYKAVYMWRRIS